MSTHVAPHRECHCLRMIIKSLSERVASFLIEFIKKRKLSKL